MSSRSSSARRALGTFGLIALLACGSENRAPAPKVSVLGGDVVAKVGSVTIERALVADVAERQHLSPRAALDILVEDALLSEGARARGLDVTPSGKFALDRIRARYVADGIESRAVARGLPSDAEVDALTARHWQTFDAPPGVRVVHVVVMQRKGTPVDASKQMAQTLADAAVGAKDSLEFLQRMQDAPHGKFDVRVETLPAFTADGRILEGSGTMEAAFVAAAFTLDADHPVTGVVETSFGWHVIRFVEKVPEKRVPFEERRERFADEAVFRRGKAEKDAIVGSYRKGTPTVIDPAADALMAGAVAGFQ